MPDETVIDGEIAALDEEGRPSFNTLQNYGSSGVPLHFFIFDVLVLKGKDLMNEALAKRRAVIEKHILPKRDDPIRYSPILDGTVKQLVESVKDQGLEGLVPSDAIPNMNRVFAPVSGRRCDSMSARSL